MHNHETLLTGNVHNQPTPMIGDAPDVATLRTIADETDILVGLLALILARVGERRLLAP